MNDDRDQSGHAHGAPDDGAAGSGRERRWPPMMRRPRRAAVTRIEVLVRREAWRLYGTAAAPAPIAPHRRPWRLAAVTTAAILTVGGVAGGAILFQSGDGSVVVDPGADRAIPESTDLRRAPWLFQPGGSPHIATVQQRRSLLFPRGTTYSRAVRDLTLSVITRGTIPRRARLVAPLPRGVVWQPGTRARGPRLSLVAPHGYAVPDGTIRTPSYRFPRGVDINQAAAILKRLRGTSLLGAAGARGLRVDTPKLLRCQINPPGRTPIACRLDPPPARSTPGS